MNLRALNLCVIFFVASCTPAPAITVRVEAQEETTNEPSEIADDLVNVVCLMGDQLKANRAAIQRISGLSMGSLMVGMTIRQVEIFNRTNKMPSKTEEELQEDEYRIWSGSMDIARLTHVVQCFDKGISECLNDGIKGYECFDEAQSTCGYPSEEVTTSCVRP